MGRRRVHGVRTLGTLAKTLLFLGLLLIYASLVAHRPLAWRGSFSFDVYDLFHWVGVAGALLFLASGVLGNEDVRAGLGRLWARAHCPVSVLAFVAAVVHSRTKAGVILPVHYSSLYILVLMGLLVLSGVGLRFLKDPRYTRWWTLFHGPATKALGLALIHHVLVKTAVI